MSKLSKEESDLLKSFEAGEWHSVQDLEQETMRLAEVAQSTMQKNKRINIRISELDLNRLRIKALEEGIPYQTLISSILHKYVTGRLSETR